jgi:hypothetical protein
MQSSEVLRSEITAGESGLVRDYNENETTRACLAQQWRNAAVQHQIVRL